MRIQVEPADQIRSKGFHDRVQGRFEPSTKRRDGFLDEIEPLRFGDGAVRAFGETNQRLRNPEKGRANLLAIHFAVLQELKVRGREAGLDDFSRSPEKQRAVGDARASLSFAQ